MSGRMIRVLEKQAFNFSNLAASGTTSIIFARRIDATQATQAELIVRIHAVSIQHASATLVLGVMPDAFTAEDPSVAWIYSGTDAKSVTLNSATSALPSFDVKTMTQGLGPMLFVYLTATQGGTGGQTITATLSADLVLKSR